MHLIVLKFSNTQINIQIRVYRDGNAHYVHYNNDYDEALVRGAQEARGCQGGAEKPETHHYDQDATNCDQRFISQV